MRTRIWTITCMIAFFAIPGSWVLAHKRGLNTQNPPEHIKFDNHDQHVSHDWYREHSDEAPLGLREMDMLNPERESQLRQGGILPRVLQGREHPIPRDLSRQLHPLPPDSRYVGIGGHLVQIDNKQRVQDVIHFELESKPALQRRFAVTAVR
jgi:hypothetical protein